MQLGFTTKALNLTHRISMEPVPAGCLLILSSSAVHALVSTVGDAALTFFGTSSFEVINVARRYSDKELLIIKHLLTKYGHLDYQDWTHIRDEYVNLTGVNRASGPLYMVAWRVENGYYTGRV